LKRLREFSEIEKILLNRVLNQLLNYMPEPWENVAAIKPRLDKVETNAQFAQIMSPNETIAVVTLTIKVGGSEGMINFCIPHVVIEPIVERLNTRYWFTSFIDEDTEGFRNDLEVQLEKAEIPVSARIGRTKISIFDFIDLQAGDIIPLDSYSDNDIDVLVGSLLKFKAKPGIIRGKNAIQITKFLEEE